MGQGDTELGYLSGWRKEDMSDYNGRMMMRGRGGLGRMAGPLGPQGATSYAFPPTEQEALLQARQDFRTELASVTEDEIWVIARERAPQAAGSEYQTPGSGAMMVEKGTEKVPLPLKHTDVKGRVCGYIATVEVTQQFQNPFSEKIEAVYVFPLPDNAAVNEFCVASDGIGHSRIVSERVNWPSLFERECS